MSYKINLFGGKSLILWITTGSTCPKMFFNNFDFSTHPNEQLMDKLRLLNHEQAKNTLWTSYEQVTTTQSWASHEQALNYEQVMKKS